MDFTQIALGTVLLAVSGLTLVGPSALGSESSPLTYLLTGAALVIGSVALLVDIARKASMA